MKNLIRFIRNRLNNVTSFFVKHYVLKSNIRNGINKEKRETKIVASLTSYAARLPNLEQCIKSIMLQKTKPDYIILWLGDDVKEEAIPDSLRKLCKWGLQIKKVEGDLKPHKKYLYAMQQFPNDIVITFDDDAYYSPYTISNLMKTHRKYPKCVCGRRVHKITFNSDGVPKTYMEWKFNNTSLKPSHELFATGVGGVLYTPNLIKKEVLSKNIIKESCLYADDIWLKTMELISDVPVVWSPCILIVPPQIKNGEIGLVSINVMENGNDKYLKILNDKYGIFEILKRKSISTSNFCNWAGKRSQSN